MRVTTHIPADSRGRSPTQWAVGKTFTPRLTPTALFFCASSCIISLRVFSFAAVFSLGWPADFGVLAKEISTNSGIPKSPEDHDAGGSEDTQQVINRWIEGAWERQGLVPTPRAEDGAWCRRVFLDVIGRIPTPAELSQFEALPRDDRRPRIVQTLLYDASYESERVDYWAGVWLNFLVGRLQDARDNSLTNRNALRRYLLGAMQDNRAYDQIVHDLIVAEGSNKPDTPEFNGAVNYLLAKLGDGTTLQATSHLSRFFLGRQVQCTQCHNHPFNEWKQSQFWELDSFLRQTVALRKYASDSGQFRYVVLTDQDFRGEGTTPEQAEIYYELRNGELRSAYPRFLDSPAANPSGILSESHRRHQLANHVVESEFLSVAIVNRFWGHFLGYGFTKPVDDMGPHNPPSHPELLQHLSHQFRTVNYDLRKLMQWILLSKPYQLSSIVQPSNKNDDPQAQRVAWFSRFYLRPMSPEQLYQSLLVLTHPRHIDESRTISAVDREDTWESQEQWMRQFLKDTDTDEGGESSTFNGTISQSLVMFHGEMTQQALAAPSGSWLHQVKQSSDALPIKIRQLFLAALSRRPSLSETSSIKKQMGTSNDLSASLSDLWWALFNSNEFILIH